MRAVSVVPRILGGMLFLVLSAQPALAQSAGAGWSFEEDTFAELWFHGLAVVGLQGFGPQPLYDEAYGRASRSPASPRMLERQAPALLDVFRRDEAFEVMHFVPLYFRGATRAEALAALRAVARSSAGTPALPASVQQGGSIVASLLSTPAQRAALGTFVDALAEEWTTVLEPRHVSGARRRDEVGTRWRSDWAPALSTFLARERAAGGTVILVPALGAEGRFLDRDPAAPSRALVMVGAAEGPGGPDATLSSLLRELCYPAVRRAFQPFEARVPDRMDASRASDLAATRFGELLLETHAPQHVAAYRARFDLPPGGMGRRFLSASGRVPGAAAWESDLDRALRRELNLDLDAARVESRPVGRNP